MRKQRGKKDLQSATTNTAAPSRELNCSLEVMFTRDMVDVESLSEGERVRERVGGEVEVELELLMPNMSSTPPLVQTSECILLGSHGY